MSNALRFCLLAAGIGVLPAQNLVDVQWLEKHRSDANLLIFDASPAKSFAAGHVPGAVNADMMAYGLPESRTAEMEKMFQAWGVSPEKTIVMYDQGGGMAATRMFFALDYYGFPASRLLILDGGLFQWQKAALPVTKDNTAAPGRGSFRIGKRNEDVQAELPEVLTASGDPVGSVLVEALGANWHFGEMRAFNRAGHIPNGVLIPSTDFYNADKTFKAPEEIRRMLRYFGIRPEQRIYTYCGGGVAASVPFFALKFILNYPSVKMYTGSELNWLADERQLPYWTYDAPFLMRRSDWVQFWGGAMLRSIGLAKVSMVDVRPAAEFAQGHLPFAVNIPAEVFRSHIRTPERLGGILGAAGVDAGHEAVVTSGAGLTKESALAFAMLEKVGQKKASIFLDSIEKSAQSGYAATREPTATRAASYAGTARPDVIITDPKSSQGVYDKVFIASGRDMPDKTPEGKVVHVPYADLLNGDGTPKAAKDIWNVLVKAGVPRYAELVCFSDDPGEAAANYVVLKLMGYPDVKVLAF